MIRKRNKYFACFFLVALLLSGCGSSFEKSETLSEVLEAKPEGIKALYFYPSTMRMLMDIIGTEKVGALEGIKEARLIFQWNDVNTNFDSYASDIESGILTEDFESLIEMNASGTDVKIFIRESKVPVYIVFYSDGEYDFILEAVGELSDEAIKELASADMGGLIELFSAGNQSEFIEDENANQNDNGGN
ncbi:MAG: hypothetical protein ABR574_00405 [Cryomorphaceae bacterium]|nr:hypothetical protein [Flavobacteriales bacterium]